MCHCYLTRWFWKSRGIFFTLAWSFCCSNFHPLTLSEFLFVPFQQTVSRSTVLELSSHRFFTVSVIDISIHHNRNLLCNTLSYYWSDMTSHGLCINENNNKMPLTVFGISLAILENKNWKMSLPPSPRLLNDNPCGHPCHLT